jgi:hypothetical protein
MQTRWNSSLLQLGAMLALMLVLAGCTKGGQFDPTVLLDNDMFNTKTRITGQRQLVFPSGVPGVTSGIPADLYKGYQPPPQETAGAAGAAVDPGNTATASAAQTGGAPTPIVPSQEAAARPERRIERRPRRKIVRARPRTEIHIGMNKRRARQAHASRAAASPSTAQAQESQSVWPAPPSTAQVPASQSVWPAPPTGPAQAAAPASQSIWPNPPATNTATQ